MTSEPTQSPTVFRFEDLPTDSPMPMLERKRIVGEHAMISQILLHKGCKVPMHTHINEQFAYITKGHMRFGIQRDPNGEPEYVEVREGELLYLPSNCPHSAEALEESIVFDVFSPTSETTGIDAHTTEG